MSDRWGNAAGGESFRFFTAEQVDQILCEGAKQGRAGSHAAIERILKHEHGLERAELWHRIRDLRHPARQSRFRRAVWSPEDDQLLRKGYVRSSGIEFRILEHVGKVRTVGRNYVTRCPSCAELGGDRSGDNLAISIEDPRKYLCWAGCQKAMIRRAVGCPIPVRRMA